MEMTPKNIIKLVAISLVSLISIIIFITSWEDVEQGSEGFL